MYTFGYIYIYTHTYIDGEGALLEIIGKDISLESHPFCEARMDIGRYLPWTNHAARVSGLRGHWWIGCQTSLQSTEVTEARLKQSHGLKRSFVQTCALFRLKIFRPGRTTHVLLLLEPHRCASARSHFDMALARRR